MWNETSFCFFSSVLWPLFQLRAATEKTTQCGGGGAAVRNKGVRFALTKTKPGRVGGKTSTSATKAMDRYALMLTASSDAKVL